MSSEQTKQKKSSIFKFLAKSWEAISGYGKTGMSWLKDGLWIFGVVTFIVGTPMSIAADSEKLSIINLVVSSYGLRHDNQFGYAAPQGSAYGSMAGK